MAETRKQVKVQCTKCGGSGKIELDDYPDYSQEIVNCSACGGHGYIWMTAFQSDE
jgi:DnaJ-class molecular chaperone